MQPILSKWTINNMDTILDKLKPSMLKYRTNVAFKSDLGGEITFDDWDKQSSNFSSFLIKRGIEKGDRVSIMLPNILQYNIAMFGIIKAGAIGVNVNPQYTKRELVKQLKDCGAKAIVAFHNVGHVIEEVIKETEIELVVMTSVGDLLSPLNKTLTNAYIKYLSKDYKKHELDYTSWETATRDVLYEIKTRSMSDEVVLLQYTGGTTGVPKGAILSHNNLVSNLDQIDDRISNIVEAGDTVICPLPLYHIYSFMVSCLVLPSKGVTSYLIADPRNVKKLVSTMKDNEFHGFTGINTLFSALMKTKGFDKIDFSKLKVTISGGMALSKQIDEQWFEKTGCHIAEGYGLSETSPVLCFNDPKDIKLGTVGKPVKDTEVRIIDNEICVQGPQVFRGYWNNERETSKAFHHQNCFRTGDIGKINDDGTLSIVDRMKDMIIVSGFNVYPTEVEEVLTEHPMVESAGVIGIHDKNKKEIIKAFVVLKGHVTKKELIQHCKENLSSYKIPKEFEFITEIPTSNIGKILHYKLREQDVAK